MLALAQAYDYAGPCEEARPAPVPQRSFPGFFLAARHQHALAACTQLYVRPEPENWYLLTESRRRTSQVNGYAGFLVCSAARCV